MLRLVRGDELPRPDSNPPQPAGIDGQRLLLQISEICLALAGAARQTQGVTSSGPTSPTRLVEARSPSDIGKDLDAWMQAHAGAIAPHTQSQVCRLVRELAGLAGAASLDGITYQHVCSLRAAMISGTGRRKCSGKSITTYMSYLHAFFEWAIQAERIRSNPANDLPKTRWVRKKQRAATPEEIQRILAAAPFEHACMIRFLAVSGIRPLHAEQLRVRFFELDSDPPRCVFIDTKTSSEREVALDIGTAGMLKRRFTGLEPDDRPFRRLHHEQWDLLLDAAGVAKNDPRGRPLGYSGLRRFGPTAAGKLGLDIESVRLQLGHSNLTTTMRHYNDADIHSQFAAASALAVAISEGIPGVVGAAVGNDLTTRGQSVEDTGVTSSTRIAHLDRAVQARSYARRTSHSQGAKSPAPFGLAPGRSADSDRRVVQVGAVGFEPTAHTTVDIGPGLQDVLHRLIDLAVNRNSVSAPPGARNDNRTA